MLSLPVEIVREQSVNSRSIDTCHEGGKVRLAHAPSFCIEVNASCARSVPGGYYGLKAERSADIAAVRDVCVSSVVKVGSCASSFPSMTRSCWMSSSLSDDSAAVF